MVSLKEAQRDYTEVINFDHVRKGAKNIMPIPKKRGGKPNNE
jgi:hypothetical protein